MVKVLGIIMDRRPNKKIIDLHDEILELRENNLKLKGKIKSLKEEKKIDEIIVFEKPYYWLKDGAKKDVPIVKNVLMTIKN